MSQLMEQILSRENMLLACKKVKINRGAGGIDNVSVYEHLKINSADSKERIQKRKHKPQPMLRVEIPKPNGEVRKLGIPTVMGRILEQAAVGVIIHTVDPYVSEYRYDFRPGYTSTACGHQVAGISE